MCSKNTFPSITRKEVMQRQSNPIRGFSLVELMIAAAVGVFLVGTAVKLYSIGLTMSWQTSQKAQLQQDFRAAANLLERDLSMAGSGALGPTRLVEQFCGLANRCRLNRYRSTRAPP